MLSRLSAKIVECDILWFNTKIFTHFHDALIHHRWTAKVVLDVFRTWVVLEVIVNHDLMDEASQTGPVVLGQRLGQCKMETEIRKFFFNRLKFINVEQLTKASSTVPVRNFAAGFQILEQLLDV